MRSCDEIVLLQSESEQEEEVQVEDEVCDGAQCMLRTMTLSLQDDDLAILAGTDDEDEDVPLQTSTQVNSSAIPDAAVVQSFPSANGGLHPIIQCCSQNFVLEVW